MYTTFSDNIVSRVYLMLLPNAYVNSLFQKIATNFNDIKYYK